MRHYAPERWAEFVRNAVDAEQRISMQAHIDQGCRDCASLVRLYERIIRVGERLKTYEPRNEDVRMVKVGFASYLPHSRRSSPSLGSELIFDSLLQPIIAGARSSDRSTRHLLYCSGPLYVDLRLENSGDPKLVLLMGQIMDNSHAKAPVRDVPVLLLAGPQRIISRASNENGEFYFEFAVEEGLTLSIAVPDGGRISVPLNILLQSDLQSGGQSTLS
jgi:hypothetical protein